jgi:hypothetical protein
MKKCFYEFDTLQEAVDFFNAAGIPLDQVRPGGWYGGPNNPTNDDDPVYFWEAT